MEIVNELKGHIRVASATCPKGHSLMTEKRLFDGEQAVVLKVKKAGHFGSIYLNPFYGRFEYECELPLVQGDVIELFCPICEIPLTVSDLCRVCHVHMCAIHLPDGGHVEICPVVGCHNHSMTLIDLDAQLARMYVAETKVKM